MLPFQNPKIATALMDCYSNVAMPHSRSRLRTCFWLRDNLAVCAIEGSATFGNEQDHELTTDVLCEWSQGLDGSHLYFPLVYSSSNAFKELSTIRGILQLRRQPTCQITVPVSAGKLSDRAFARLGNRANRRLRRFEESGAIVVTLSGTDASEALTEIEKKSWKFSVGQSLQHKDQLKLFLRLIDQSLVTLRFAILGQTPIAYRLDHTTRNYSSIWKWSFSEEFRSISPGFYLLVSDLFNCYGLTGTHTIDLYGGPDLLKLAICDRFTDRHDFYWPTCNIGGDYLAERARHDLRSYRNLKLGRSIRSVLFE